jgi:hypothetical protein
MDPVGHLVLRRSVGQGIRIGNSWVRVCKARGEDLVFQVVADLGLNVVREELVPEAERPAWQKEA